MATNYNDKLDTVIGVDGKPIAIIAEKDSQGKFLVPMKLKGSDGNEIIPATQTTAAAILTALADLATVAKQDTGNTALADILAKLQSGLTLLNGSIPEYQWLNTDAPPILGSTDRAFGIEINSTTNVMTTKYWTGSAWQGVA
jgi:hypothetical protein